MAKSLLADDLPTFVLQAWAALTVECGGEIPGDWTVARLQAELGRVSLAMIAERRAEADG